MTSPLLIVGLGNPGSRYALHRHNVGFMLVDRLNRQMALQTVSRPEGDVFKGSWKSFDILTLKPATFMNASGQAVQSLMRFYKIPLTSVYVIHDDLDLKPQDVRFKRGGGDGGHNGLRSITAHVGAHYARLRIGIGRPSLPQQDITSYVLGPFSSDDQVWLLPLLERITQHADHLFLQDNPASFFQAISDHAP